MTDGAGGGSSLLSGVSAVVTGGGRGIGLAVARGYLRHGAKVVLADIDFETAEVAARQLATELGVDRQTVSALLVDVTDPASVAAAADQAERAVGPINCIVANAGILVLGPVLETSLADWRRVIDVNLTGAFVTCKEFGGRMVGRGPGRIILTSSLFGLRGGLDNCAYSSSKFGMLGLMECLAAEMAPHDITVNAVCPGQVMTDMIRTLSVERAASRHTTPEAVLAVLNATIPMGRLADPAEIADVYVYLASSLSGYVTGQAMLVDGGISVG